MILLKRMITDKIALSKMSLAKIRFNPEKDVVLREEGKIVPKKSDFGIERVWIFAKIEFEDSKKQ